MVKPSKELEALGSELGVDVEGEYAKAQASLLKRDYGQFSRMLQVAHESLWCQNTRLDLGPGGDPEHRKNALTDAVWTIAIIHEADQRRLRGVPDEANPLPPPDTAAAISLPFRAPRMRVAPKGLNAYTEGDIFPGAHKVPQGLERDLLGAMEHLDIPLATGNASVPRIDLGDKVQCRLLDELKSGGLTRLTLERFKGSQPITDARPLYQGMHVTRVSQYDGGMSARELAESKTHLNGLTVR